MELREGMTLQSHLWTERVNATTNPRICIITAEKLMVIEKVEYVRFLFLCRSGRRRESLKRCRDEEDST